MVSKLYFFLAFFILLNAFFIISANDLQLNEGDNVKEFFSIYAKWLQQIGNNLKEITGKVVSQNWTP